MTFGVYFDFRFLDMTSQTSHEKNIQMSFKSYHVTEVTEHHKLRSHNVLYSFTIQQIFQSDLRHLLLTLQRLHCPRDSVFERMGTYLWRRNSPEDSASRNYDGKSWNSTSLLVPKRPGKKMLLCRERQLILQMT